MALILPRRRAPSPLILPPPSIPCPGIMGMSTESVLLSCSKEKWLEQIDTLSGSARTGIQASISCISLLSNTREIVIEIHECRGKNCDARDSLFIITDEWGYLSGFPFCLSSKYMVVSYGPTQAHLRGQSTSQECSLSASSSSCSYS